MSNFNAYLLDHGINPTDENLALPDVFVFGRIYANDHINKSSIEIHPSWVTDSFKCPPHISIAFKAEHVQHFHEWGATPVGYARISFTSKPVYDDRDTFLHDVNLPIDAH